MRSISYLHDTILSVLIIGITGGVASLLMSACFLFNARDLRRKRGELLLCHATQLEIVWTILPSFILLGIAIPSFSFLYQIERLGNPLYTIKVLGHQWYWTYEYLMSDIEVSEIYGIMESIDDLSVGQLRLLETEYALIVPVNETIRFLVTSDDVLHCWAIPALGIKIDACPGRINQLTTIIQREGVYYGQCSEICGINHGFMPIKLVAISQSFSYFIRLLSLEN